LADHRLRITVDVVAADPPPDDVPTDRQAMRAKVSLEISTASPADGQYERLAVSGNLARESLVGRQHRLKRINDIRARLPPAAAFADRSGHFKDLRSYPAIPGILVTDRQLKRTAHPGPTSAHRAHDDRAAAPPTPLEGGTAPTPSFYKRGELSGHQRGFLLALDTRDGACSECTTRSRSSRLHFVTMRRNLERALGPTVRPAMAARLLGVRQAALDRWVALGDVSTLVIPTAGRKVPLGALVALIGAGGQRRDR